MNGRHFCYCVWLDSCGRSVGSEERSPSAFLYRRLLSLNTHREKEPQKVYVGAIRSHVTSHLSIRTVEHSSVDLSVENSSVDLWISEERRLFVVDRAVLSVGLVGLTMSRAEQTRLDKSSGRSVLRGVGDFLCLSVSLAFSFSLPWSWCCGYIYMFFCLCSLVQVIRAWFLFFIPFLKLVFQRWGGEVYIQIITQKDESTPYHLSLSAWIYVWKFCVRVCCAASSEYTSLTIIALQTLSVRLLQI